MTDDEIFLEVQSTWSFTLKYVYFPLCVVYAGYLLYIRKPRWNSRKKHPPKVSREYPKKKGIFPYFTFWCSFFGDKNEFFQNSFMKKICVCIQLNTIQSVHYLIYNYIPLLHQSQSKPWFDLKMYVSTLIEEFEREVIKKNHI